MRATILSAGMMALLLGPPLTSLSLAQNVVTDWQAITESTVVDAGRDNAVALPYFAYVDVAMYDAVSAIDGRFQHFAISVDAPRAASMDAAAASAAHDVLVHYFPAQAPALDAALAKSLGGIANDQSKTSGIRVGKVVAAQWLTLRSADGLEAPLTYSWGHGAGVWEPVPSYAGPSPNTPPPLGVWMRQFQPFALRRADQLLGYVKPPPSVKSAEWAQDFNETKSYGASHSPVRTAIETEIGLFWTDNTASQYSSLFRQLATRERLDIANAARLAAMYSVAGSDAATACMNAKYHFAFWRPYTAIHDAASAGNPEVKGDSHWIPLAVTPQHPEYPANHGCITQAVMDTFTTFFGTNAMSFTVTSAVTGKTHSFTRFDDVVREVNNARIYGGMHFRHAVDQGNRLGHRVTEFVFKQYFQPTEATRQGTAQPK